MTGRDDVDAANCTKIQCNKSSSKIQELQDPCPCMSYNQYSSTVRLQIDRPLMFTRQPRDRTTQQTTERNNRALRSWPKFSSDFATCHSHPSCRKPRAESSIPQPVSPWAKGMREQLSMRMPRAAAHAWRRRCRAHDHNRSTTTEVLVESASSWTRSEVLMVRTVCTSSAHASLVRVLLKPFGPGVPTCHDM